MCCLWLRFSAYRTRNAAICVCGPLLNPSSDCLELENWKRRTVGCVLDAISRATTPTASSPGAIRAVWVLPSRTFTGVSCLILSLAACSSPNCEFWRPYRDWADRTPSNWYTRGVSMVYGSVPWLQTVYRTSRRPSFSYRSLIHTSTGFEARCFEGSSRIGFPASSSSVIEGETETGVVVAVGFTGSRCTGA